jgi:pimeloyl-ACP methyl ester carboxylesterase
LNTIPVLRTRARSGSGSQGRTAPDGVRRWTATAAIVAGVIGVAAGVGIGVRHLQVAGMSATAGAGLVVMVIGLAFTGGGTATLVRTVRGWRRWLAVPVGLLVVWFALWPLTVALMATHVPPTRLGAATPADLGTPHEDVTFTTADGVRLSAWYLPSRNGAAVVLRHGATSTRSATLQQAVVLARNGYGVLATDARGHGRSGGDAMDLGWHGDADVAAAVTYLTNRPDVDAGRVAVVGLSMGGEEALGAAAADRRILAVIAEGVSTRGIVADEDLVLPGHPGRWMNIAQTWIQQRLTAAFTSARPPQDLRAAVVATAPRPVLLITGLAAPGGEVTAGRRLRAAAPTTVTLWEVADAPHTGGLAARPGQWEARVIGFLDRAVGPHRRAATPARMVVPDQHLEVASASSLR